MTAEELKTSITDSDMLIMLQKLGATVYQDTSEYYVTDTICHCGTSHKLYYYKDSHSFHCYTECGNLDIIELVQRVKNCTFFESMVWITNQCNLQQKRGFNNVQINDWDFIRSYKPKSLSETVQELPAYSEKILNIFQKQYYKGWIDEGISVETMERYNILSSPMLGQIIIPHYDINNRLIGIRGRTLDPLTEEIFGKYAPIRVGDTVYKHPLSDNMYGLNHNADTIRRTGKVMLVEGEKSVLQADTMFGDNNFTLAVSGSSFSSKQRDVLLSLGIKEVMIALDKQFQSSGTDEAVKWAEHIRKKFVTLLSPYFSVYVIWDTDDLLDYKQSPTDKGKETLLKLMKSKIFVPSSE